MPPAPPEQRSVRDARLRSSHVASGPVRWSLLLIDGGLVVLFAVLGNRSHDTGLGIGDVLGTAGPFLVALILTTLLLRGHRRPSRMVPDGLVVWTGTVAGGMLLRAATDLGGVQVSFVLVAAGVLGVLLCGRRLLTGLLLPATRG